MSAVAEFGRFGTHCSWRSKRVVKFYNGRGTAEQWTEEGKNAVKWTKLSPLKRALWGMAPTGGTQKPEPWARK